MADQPEEQGTDAAPQAAGSEAVPTPQPLIIHYQYIKDLSFEVPSAPGIFARIGQQQPKIDVRVSVDANSLAENQYEVVLQIAAKCEASDSVAFVLELSYAGLFGVNVADELVRPMLLIECPRMLFPFARHIISNATRDGGFMPLVLGPVDFVRLYQQQNPESPTAQSAPAADEASETA